MKGSSNPNNKKTRISCRRRLRVLRLRFSPTTPAGEKSKLDERVAAADHNSSTSSTEYSSDNSSRRGKPAMNTTGGAEGPSSSPSGSLVYGHVSVMGRRRDMEDKVTVAPPGGWMSGGEYHFFGVYDGHGGDKVAEKCREEMHTCLARRIEKLPREAERAAIDWEKVMVDCFSSMDDELDRDEAAAAAYKNMGSTAAVVLVGEEEIVVAHCGDSRVVLCRGGVAVPISIYHKPDREDERERIEAAGGQVINYNGWRVQGVLATSRSFGDDYLKPYVTSVPEVTAVRRTGSDEFLIVATDGLFDVVSNEVACEVVKEYLTCTKNRRQGASAAATLLAGLAIAKGSRDNLSVIVVQLNK